MASPDPKLAPKNPPKAEHKVDPTFLLFMRNMEKIRLYYNREKYAGETLGYNTMMEIMAGHLTAAGEMAMQGKEWMPS